MDMNHLIPIYAVTGFFGVIFIAGPFLVPKGESKGIIQCCIMLSAFCMWLLWFTVYASQINPLMGPIVENGTVAWMLHKDL